MRGIDWAILAGIGVVGFGLLKSDFFKGFGAVGTGVGDAVSGVGSAVGYAGQSAGYNLADIFNAFGQLGLQTNTIVKEGGETFVEVVKEVKEDVVPTVDYLGNIPKDIAETGSAWSGSLRDVGKYGADKFKYVYGGDLFSDVFSWIKKQSPLKITGAVISPTISSLSSYNTTSTSSPKSSGTKSIRTPITPAGTSSFMESIGYVGTSTLEGVKWSLPAPTLPF